MENEYSSLKREHFGEIIFLFERIESKCKWLIFWSTFLVFTVVGIFTSVGLLKIVSWLWMLFLSLFVLSLIIVPILNLSIRPLAVDVDKISGEDQKLIRAAYHSPLRTLEIIKERRKLIERLDARQEKSISPKPLKNDSYRPLQNNVLSTFKLEVNDRDELLRILNRQISLSVAHLFLVFFPLVGFVLWILMIVNAAEIHSMTRKAIALLVITILFPWLIGLILAITTKNKIVRMLKIHSV